MPLSLSPKNINWDANGSFSPVETNVHFCGNLYISVWQNHVCVDVSSKGFQRFLTMTINVRIMPAASEQSLFIQSGLNAAAGRKETELIYYFSPDFHSTHFFTWPIFFNRPIFSLGPFFTQLAFSLNLTNSA